MITGIEGRPGSGKSYYLLTEIIRSLKSGRKVITNVYGIAWRQLCLHLCGRDLAAARSMESRVKVIRAEEFISGAYKSVDLRNGDIFLDEIMLLMFSRNWKQIDQGFILWLSQHRKFRCNLTYITQSFDRLDKTILEMTQNYYTVRNMAAWTSVVPLPKFFIILKRGEDRKDVMERNYLRPTKALYRFYDTYARFDSESPPGGVFHQPPMPCGRHFCELARS